MPKWVEDCVKEKMADSKFKPQEGKTKEESAWAVCQTIYKERVQASTITLELITEPATFVVANEKSGEVLRFRNAILVVAETNSNQDTILEEELQNLAATLPGRPIDDDHAWQKCVGVFTEASVVKVGEMWGLRVSGLIWADRFPEAADGVRTGRLKLSIEADAASAECSICGDTFSRAVEYCEHLLDRVRHGANRILHGLRAVGGGLTPNPAGTGTDFDPTLVYFVAHHLEEGGDAETDTTVDAEPSPEERQREKEQQTEGGSSMDKTLEQLQAELQEMTRKHDEQVVVREGVEASLAEVQEQIETLTAKVEELTGQLDTANQEKAQVVTAHRKEVLVMKGMDEKEIEGKEEDIGSMTDAQFELLIANVKPAQSPSPGASGGFSPDGGGGGGGGDDKVLTL
jgi:hypothetical protein